MGQATYLSDEPRLASADFKTAYGEPCKCFEGSQTWYMGSGVVGKHHPLSDWISFGACGHCESADVLVIAAQHCIHPMNGDEYYDYELVCNACNRFTVVGYCDNDD